jgi:hypothetical protein
MSKKIMLDKKNIECPPTTLEIPGERADFEISDETTRYT